MSKPPPRRPKLYIVNLQVRPIRSGSGRTVLASPPPRGLRGRGREPTGSRGSVAPQWTPKDDLAALKLHGRCDDVMRLLMAELGLEIPRYDR